MRTLALPFVVALLALATDARADEWHFTLDAEPEVRLRWFDSLSTDSVHGASESGPIVLSLSRIVGVRREEISIARGALIGASVGAMAATATALTVRLAERPGPCPHMSMCLPASFVVLVVGAPSMTLLGSMAGMVLGEKEITTTQATFPPDAPSEHKAAVIRSLLR